MQDSNQMSFCYQEVKLRSFSYLDLKAVKGYSNTVVVLRGAFNSLSGLNLQRFSFLLITLDLKQGKVQKLHLLSRHAIILHIRYCVSASGHVLPPNLGAGSLHVLFLFCLP